MTIRIPIYVMSWSMGNADSLSLLRDWLRGFRVCCFRPIDFFAGAVWAGWRSVSSLCSTWCCGSSSPVRPSRSARWSHCYPSGLASPYPSPSSGPISVSGAGSVFPARSICTPCVCLRVSCVHIMHMTHVYTYVVVLLHACTVL